MRFNARKLQKEEKTVVYREEGKVGDNMGRCYNLTKGHNKVEKRSYKYIEVK